MRGEGGIHVILLVVLSVGLLACILGAWLVDGVVLLIVVAACG